MRKEFRTERELQDMILAELKASSVKVRVSHDPVSATWRAISVGDVPLEVVARVQDIAERLRAQYDLTIEE